MSCVLIPPETVFNLDHLYRVDLGFGNIAYDLGCYGHPLFDTFNGHTVDFVDLHEYLC